MNVLIIAMAIIKYSIIIQSKREDSVIAILCRNKDLNDIKETLINFELQFNYQHHYPYVFLNDEDWTDSFKKEIKEVTISSIEFGKVDSSDWNPPENISITAYMANWIEMEKKGVPYASMLSYHNMCRFFSLKFHIHPLLSKYKYYWRIEPGVRFRCPIDNDPFEEMSKNGYFYGFTISILEHMPSIASLGDTTARFISEHKDLIPDNIKPLEFMFQDGSYNGCHFWSNFEIGDFDFFRSEVYRKYVEYLDMSGGFYKERWGDAPVHSLAVALFADKHRIHFFEDIGYTHFPFTHCPKNKHNCDCLPAESIDWGRQSCLKKYLNEMQIY